MNSPLTNIRVIAQRELAGYFASPVAYVFIVIFLLLSGFFTFMVSGFFERGEATLTSFFIWHPWLYLFLVPSVGMRLWSEERRLGTIEFLLTLPVTTGQAIAGKFLASWLFLGVALVLTFPLVLTVNHLGSPDNGVIIGGYVGSLLMAGSYLAVSCLTSAITRNQVVSFILSVVACLFLILAGWPPVTNFLAGITPDSTLLVDLTTSFSVMSHFESFQRGVLDSRDILFFLSLIGFSLFATAAVVRGIRE
jgi:ABC-2 type transport system permease protein